MNGSKLYNLCDDKEWPEVRKYLSSNAAEEEKKLNIMYRNHNGWTGLHQACCRGAPDDIMKAMLDIGGKELVVEVDNDDWTVLHWACVSGTSYNIIKMLINVGGKDLVMAKDKSGDNTALHFLCWLIKSHTMAAEKIKLILQAGDDTLLLSAKNHAGQTPLGIVTDRGTSNKIKKLLTLQQMMKQEEGEAPFAQELLEVSNRRAAALKAIVETQRLEIADLLNEKNGIEKEIADLSNEKDGIEKECKYKVDKLTRKLLKQQAELQLLKDSSSDVEVGRMKRKHTNEEHEEGEGTPVVQSQSQSSKRSRSENAANISSVSLDINLAEDEDAAVIAGYNMLMSQHMATRRELRIAKARNVELKQEIDDLAI
jgi:DNA-binding transcriptional ArsR family regulator